MGLCYALRLGFVENLARGGESVRCGRSGVEEGADRRVRKGGDGGGRKIWHGGR